MIIPFPMTFKKVIVSKNKLFRHFGEVIIVYHIRLTHTLKFIFLLLVEKCRLKQLPCIVVKKPVQITIFVNISLFYQGKK